MPSGSSENLPLREPLEAVMNRAPEGWRPFVQAWQCSAAGQAVKRHVDARVAEGVTVYPAQVLRALELTPLGDVKAVILGQDPYHGPGQAHGLAFSVPDGVRTPPSLRNIFAELKRDLGVERHSNDLAGWARQGVLLLNTSLTVEAGQAGSHARRGWESLTQSLLHAVAARGQPCAYLLWGAHAQAFAPVIEGSAGASSPPLLLMSNHPSPLSARRPPVPFLGCGHFGQVDRHLAAGSLPPVDWGA